MTVKQFRFSLFVGSLLVILGAVLSTQASIGIALLGLGFAIALLAIFTRYAEKNANKAVAAPLAMEQIPQSASVES